VTGVECFAITDAGGQPGENEDAVVLDAAGGIFVVADGLGGRPGGAIASWTAAEALHSRLKAAPVEVRLTPEVMQDAMECANAAVRARAAADPLLEGMGAAIAGLAVGGMHCAVAHAGDCRVYLLRGGSIEQLTKDHTLVAELVARNHLSPEGARHHPLRNVLARCAGTNERIVADTLNLELRMGDLLLMATDGLSKGLEPEGIRAVLENETERPLGDVAKALMHEALKDGPGDNVTIVLVRMAGLGPDGGEAAHE